MISPPSATLPVRLLVCAALLIPAAAMGQETARSETTEKPGIVAAKSEAAKAEPAKAELAKAELAKAELAKIDAPPRDVQAYCANIAVAASDARIAWQTAKLNELEAKLKASIQALDAKAAELRALAAKRAELEKQAGEKLVVIYAKMRPETAAAQISGLDDEMAAAVLGQLQPRQASLIFNEIVPERASKLAMLIAGAAPDRKP